MTCRTKWFALALCPLLFVCPGCKDSKDAPLSKGGSDTEPSVASGVTISGTRWDARKDDGTGTLYAQTTDGKEHLVEVGAIDSWFSQDRRTLYYTYRHEKSGYEREGMGVKRFQTESGKSSLIFDHDLIIVFVREATTKKGRTAIVVEMIDGGRGAPELVVADPERGRVYIAERARVMGTDQGQLKVGYLTDAQIDGSEFGQWPAPSKTEVMDLDALLDREASRLTPNPLPND
jgi:hypothetical protein